MLRIENIRKEYRTGNLHQIALNNVSINFRENEFVAILGPSGSGKTTLLNIIGGLDRYDDGDLIINNISTKKYKDRDYDSYRNHNVGFIFQNYNLIPHQTILSNVELSLTISGISRKQRKIRAKKALEDVGLSEHLHKKPNQLSGGQMQRVAIARALVNNPNILLADEPTGALDTKTSIQIMELLKEVAKDRLVIMVTHNPDLARDYANRIIKLQDGKIIDDSNPYIINDTEDIKHHNMGKASMSFLTSLSLSFNNLITKKGRTILTAFAGSIGIIGIALILSLSTGFQNYIDKIQEDTLSSYPLTITSETADASSMILAMVSNNNEDKNDLEILNEKQYITSMFSSIGSNDIVSFKKYIEDNIDKIKDDVSDIQYNYSISPLIYTIDVNDNLVQINPSSMMSTFYSDNASSFITSYTSGSGIFNEVSIIDENIMEQYDLLKGKWPKNYNEMIVVLSEPNTISDLLVYSLGLRNTEELKDMMNKFMAGEEIKNKDEPKIFNYDDLLNLKLKLIDPSNIYQYNVTYDVYEDMHNDKEYLNKIYAEAEDLKIVGIVCAKKNNSSMILKPGVVYLSSLTNHIIKKAEKSYIVSKQLNNKDIDVFSGKNFDEEDQKDNELNFDNMISIDENKIKEAFVINIPNNIMTNEEEISKMILEISHKTAKDIVDNSNNIAGSILALDMMVSQMMINYYPIYVMDIDCEEYVDNNNHQLGCIIPKDKDNEYQLYNDINIKKKQIINFSDENIKDYKEYFFNEKIKDINNIIPEEYKFIDPDLYLYLTKDVATKVFDKYIEAVLLVANKDKDITMEVLTSLDTNIIISSILADEELLNVVANQTNEIVVNYTTMMVAGGIGEATNEIMKPISAMFNNDKLFEINTNKFAEAFRFNLNQEELSRLLEVMMSSNKEKSYKSNLLSLGYQDLNNPTSISFYFKNFEGKENFINFINEYNNKMEEEKKIKYTDITGILMSSVKTIVDSVSYVLIAFVSISLIVSSIMIAVITLISVMERTKEIGILRAMGASKRNISSIFNAETFIIGLLSGLLGIIISRLLLFPINNLIHTLTNNYDINAILPFNAAIILIIISILLTIIAGLIPAKKAAKKDPVIALRTE